MLSLSDPSRLHGDSTISTSDPGAPDALEPLWGERPNLVWALLVPAAVLVGYAVDVMQGAGVRDEGILCLGLALLFAIAAVVLGRMEWPETEPFIGPLTVGAIGLGLAIQFCLGLRSLPAPNLQFNGLPELQQYLSGVGFAAVLAGALLSPRPFLGKATFPVLIIAFVALAGWVIGHSQPKIDVLTYQRDSCAALLRGENPYAITFADPYKGNAPEWFGPGLARDGRLWFGFPYTPLSLWMALPGHAIAGEVRYAHLSALAIAGLLIGFSRNTPISLAAAALLLFMSRTMLVINEAWTEPFVVATLAAVACCAVRAPRLTPWMFGLFIVSKQYAPLCAPLALLLCPRPWRTREIVAFALKATIVAAAVTLPLALWNPRAFWHSAVTVQLMAPFRPDALSFMAWRANPQHPPSSAWAFVAMALAMALSLWRCPRNVAGFCGGVALSYLAFFTFNKQAFANYYFFVIAAMCCAIAVAAGNPVGGTLVSPESASPSDAAGQASLAPTACGPPRTATAR